MCIYYKDRKNLHYAKQEHIVSAAIGGIKKLPKGYVSDEFNSGISKLEQDSLSFSFCPKESVTENVKARVKNSLVILTEDAEVPEFFNSRPKPAPNECRLCVCGGHRYSSAECSTNVRLKTVVRHMFVKTP